MALRARIYAYNRHLSFDVAFICSTLTHCGVWDLSVWRLKWEVSYVHQRVWRWKWFSCQSSYVLQRLRLCGASDTVFRREIDSRRQWGFGTCYGDSFPAAKECTITAGRTEAVWYERLAQHLHTVMACSMTRAAVTHPDSTLLNFSDLTRTGYHSAMCYHVMTGRSHWWPSG